MHISDQIALVSAGARGLGAALTQTFLDAGVLRIIHLHRHHDLCDQLVRRPLLIDNLATSEPDGCTA